MNYLGCNFTVLTTEGHKHTMVPCVFVNASLKINHWSESVPSNHHDMIQDTGPCIILTLTDTLFISCLVLGMCPRTEAGWVRWEPGGDQEEDNIWLLITFLAGRVLLSSCPLSSLSLSTARSVTSYKSNNKNAVTAISATHGLTVNLPLLVLRATNKPLFIKHRNILAWKHFF